jgi:hypothetical protein
MKPFNFLLVTVFVVLFQCISCSSIAQENETATYSRFEPSSNSLFKISYEYPVDWKWDIDNDPVTWEGMKAIYLPSPTAVNESNKSFGEIYIQVKKEDNSNIASHANNISIEQTLIAAELNSMPGTIAKNMILVDWHKAYYITYTKKPSTPQENGHFSVQLFWSEDNLHYYIVAFMSEDQRNGFFGQAVDHLIKTIKFLK